MLSKTNLPLEILQFACLKIDQAKRHQYWMFDVERSMFDVLLSINQVLSVIHCTHFESHGYQNQKPRLRCNQK